MRKAFLAAVIAVAAGAVPAMAQSAPKFAYIDSRQIIAEAPGAREAQQAFERDMARFQAEIEGLENEIKELLSEYEQKQVMMSPDAKRQSEQRIMEKQRAYQQRAGELEDQAARRQAELVEPIMARINAVIDEIRKEGGYAMIFDAAAGALIAADPALDITSQVLTRLRATARQP